MIGVLAQSTPQAESWQLLVAVLVLSAMTVAALAVHHRGKYQNLTEGQQREKRNFVGQREDQRAASLRVTPEDLGSTDLRRRLSELFDSDRQLDDERPTVRSGVAAARRELRAAWGSRTGGIPDFALKLSEEAVVLLVLGALAVVSIDSWRRLFAVGDGDVSLSGAVEAVRESLAWLAETATAALGLFPYGDVVWGVSLGYGLLIAEWLFFTPWLAVALLAVLAVVVGWLETRLDTTIDEPVIGRRSLAVGLLAWSGLIWLAGAVPAALLSLAGFETVGGVVGLLAAFAVLVRAVVALYDSVRGRLTYLSALLEGERRTIAGYIIARRLAIGLASLVLPLIPIYAAYILLTGRLLAIAEAFFAGSIGMQLLVIVLVVAAVVGFAWQIRQSWGELRAGFAETISRRAIRVSLLARGFPVATAIFLGLLAVGFGAPLPLSVAIGLASGLIVRVAVAFSNRIRRRARLYEREPRTANRVIVHAYTLDTAGGDQRYYAEVNTTQLAHESKAQLVDAIVETSRRLFDDGDPGMCVEQQFASDMFDYGETKIADSRKKLIERAKLTTDAEFDGQRLVEVDELESTLDDEVPEPFWREHLRRRVRNGETIQRGEYYVDAR